MTRLFRRFRKPPRTRPPARARLVVEPLEDRAVPASSFLVTTLADETNPNDGLQSLREAVAAANSDPDVNVITFAASLSGTITLTGGELLVNQPATIQGPGAGVITASGGDASRIFNIDNGAIGAINVSISGLTLTRGNAGNDSGGAIAVGDEALALSGVDITGNTANFGGGIYLAGGLLTLENCTVSGSRAPGSGGGLFLDSNTTTVVRSSTVSGNDATGGEGGGIFASVGASLAVENSTIAGNRAGLGGGIGIENGTLVIRNSTVSGNSAVGEGGGVFSLNADLSPSTTVENTTISGNAAGSDGGGIFLSKGTTRVRNTTVAFNRADNDNTGGGNGGGIAADGVTAVRLQSTLVGDNAAGTTGTGPDISGTLVATNSLIGNTAGTLFVEAFDSDILGMDPLLGPLQFNGGPTKTHALLAGSPAINHGANPGGLSTDQRGSGFRRAAGAGVDIGAFEVQSPLPPTTQALQAAAQIIRMLQPSGVRLAAAAFADLNGDFASDFFFALKLKSGRLLVVTLNGTDGHVLGAFAPFPAKLQASAHVRLLTADLNGDEVPEVALVISNGGIGVPRLSAFTVTGRRLL